MSKSLNYRIFLVIFISCLLPAYFFGQDCFNSNLSSSERNTLSQNKVVIRKIDSLKEVSINSKNEAITKVLSEAKKLGPIYIAEIIQVKPYVGNENLLQNFETLILDIPSYAGIPYYSERAEKWYDLYSSATITSSTTNNNTKKINADLEMEPFGIINTQIDTMKTDSYFFYESTNLNKLRYYDKFNCVSPQKMKSLIAIYRDGDHWVLYGLGIVNAPNVFFLRDRIETSFMNRIKTFCAYFFEKL